MKRVICTFIILFLTSYVFANDMILNNVVLSYELPHFNSVASISDPFVITKQTDEKKSVNAIQFPGITSVKYKNVINSNMVIQLELLDDKITAGEYILYYLNSMQFSKTYYNTEDDKFDNKVEGSYGFLVKMNYGNTISRVYVLAAVYNHVGILITFETTEDLYGLCRPIVKEIINSIRVK